MEHRWHIRHPAVLDILLHHENISEIHCKSRNIGRDGMFVETDYMAYRPHTMLQVEFQSGQGKNIQMHTLPAIVVHSSPEGLGLMFMQPNAYDLICSNAIIVEGTYTSGTSTLQAEPKLASGL